MKNYKSILCLVLSLVLIVSVAFPLGASAVEEPGAGRDVMLTFVCGGETVEGPVRFSLDDSKTELTPEDLAEFIPEGCRMTESLTLLPGESEYIVILEKIPTAPANKNIPIKFMSDGTTVVSTQYVTVVEGKELTLSPEALAVLAPEGYELMDKEHGVTVSFNTAEVRVLVSKVEQPLPEVKEVPVKYMTDGTTVVGTATILVEEGSTVVVDAFKLGAMAPEGYELVDKEHSVTVTFDTKEVRVLVSEIEVPAPEHKNVPIKFMTDGTTVVETRYVTVAEGEEITLTPEALAVLAPEGYELMDKTMSVKVTFNTKEVRVLVAALNKTVLVNYVTEDGECVLTSSIVLDKDATNVNTSMLKDVPYGYEIAMTGDMPIVDGAVNVTVRQLPYTKSILVNYVTEDGECVLTSSIVLDKDAANVNTSMLKDVPYGYEIAVTGDMPIVDGAVNVTVREMPYTKSIPIKFMTDGTTVVATQYISLYKDEEITLTPDNLTALAPEGYELMDKEQSVKVTFNTKEVRVLVVAQTQDVLVNYVTEDGECVLTSSIVLDKDATNVNTSMLKDVPYGYEIAVTGDMPIVDGAVNVTVRQQPYTKSVLVNYVTEDGECVLTSSIVLDKDATNVNTSMLKDVPYGYEIAVTGDMPIVDGAVNVTVRQQPYTKSVLVNYVTEDGECVLTSSIVLDKDATNVNTSLLKDVPYGYEIAVTGDMPIEDGQIYVVVRSTYVPETTEPTVPETTEPEQTEPSVPETTEPEQTEPSVPETTEPEQTKPSVPETTAPSVPATTEGKTPNTGDASDAMTWMFLLTISAVCAACVFFYNKKKAN